MIKLRKVLTALITLSALTFAQNEFTVNTYSDSTQRDPQIGMDAAGNYVIVWDSEAEVSALSQSDIYLQLFDFNDQKIGSETLVNTFTEGEQERPALAVNNNGDFLVVWASHSGTSESIFDIKARLFKSNTATAGEFLVNTTTAKSQTNPSAAASGNGNYVVVWESWDQDGSDRGVFAQILDADGNPVGSEFQVNTTTAYSQAKPAVKFMPNGNFVVVWESWRQDIATPYGYGVFGKIFASDGSVVKDEFQINTYTNDYQWFGDIETFTDNSFIVVWCSWEQDGYDGGIYMQQFDAAGNRIESEILVNRTTAYYQWLPRIRRFVDNGFAVAWSSWQTDGSREGVYTQTYDRNLKKLSFETRLNDVVEGYQWEPDFATFGADQIIAVWAGWDSNLDYEIFTKRISPQSPQGSIIPSTYNHTAGVSTSRIHVYVVDSTNISGNEYEVTFDLPNNNDVFANIKNLTTGTDVVSGLPILREGGGFFLTPQFDGVKVEIVPEFDFKLDIANSYFKNNTGTNILMNIENASGSVHLSPIDAMIVWGSTDTTSGGTYAAPLDTAYGLTGQKTVECPFYAWNITDNEPMEMFIVENTPTKNDMWDPGEKITLLTPLQYNPVFPRFHATVNPAVPAGNIVMPGIGDTVFIFTKRPLTTDDKFTFTTLPGYITSTGGSSINPFDFRLEQNYPNPFNPTTTIEFAIPKEGFVKLTIYNILGQRIQTLINGPLNSGYHKRLFNASGLASGVYLYTIEFDKNFISKKMLLLK